MKAIKKDMEVVKQLTKERLLTELNRRKGFMSPTPIFQDKGFIDIIVDVILDYVISIQFKKEKMCKMVKMPLRMISFYYFPSWVKD